MSYPNAYAPIAGHTHQILCRNTSYSREWEHCDYATSSEEKKQLLTEYRLAYGSGWEFKTIWFPAKYWPQQTA